MRSCRIPTDKLKIKKQDDYQSPRWSGEILDCSLPMTLDTYSKCSFNCLYCFSYNQKSHSLDTGGTVNYQTAKARWVNVDNIRRMMELDPTLPAYYHQFFPYIRDRKVIQWGGLSDQFDMFEKRYGITLELLKIFKKHNYPLTFSTKATWWLDDERYLELFRGQDNWNLKISIINLNAEHARQMEKGVVSPEERIKALGKYAKLNKGGATLRLRPFIIGYSDYHNDHLKLIEMAGKEGVTALSTEFFCLEMRADEDLKKRYKKMGEIAGFDIYNFYRKHSKGSGYLRLNYEIKRKYIEEMEAAAKKAGMRFYVSDEHHKEKSEGGCCCGLPETWNYSRGQFTEALIFAKKHGEVRWSDIKDDVEKYHGHYKWGNASGFNTGTTEKRLKRLNMTMADYIRQMWNDPKAKNSPYRYFDGVLVPIGLDEDNNIIYKYNQEKAKT